MYFYLKLSNMSHRQIDLVNIGLIFLALFMAFKIPFELFLFSYAFLGPLHYLTEINWLHQKNYFTQNKNILWPLGILAFLVCFVPTMRYLQEFNSLKNMVSPLLQSTFIQTLEKWSTNLLFIALSTAIAAVLTKKTTYLLATAVISTILSYFLMDIPNYIILAGVFTPTIFHVYVFTGLFMLYGAFKEKSVLGFLSVFLLLFSIVIIINADIDPKEYLLSENTKNNFISSTFSLVLTTIAHFFHIVPPNKPLYLLSENGIKIQIFIAFAYTYHYLNWFSKTSVIKWHQVNRTQFFVIALFWLIAVGLYYYSFRLGFIALLFLSMLHVFLEFPLNYVSVRGIIQSLGKSSS
jgi:hypothetical protein